MWQSKKPTSWPTNQPTAKPMTPTAQPSPTPSAKPIIPTAQPSAIPSVKPIAPTLYPTPLPSAKPITPTAHPIASTAQPTAIPSVKPVAPTVNPTPTPSAKPIAPTAQPSAIPSSKYMSMKTKFPTLKPSVKVRILLNTPYNNEGRLNDKSACHDSNGVFRSSNGSPVDCRWVITHITYGACSTLAAQTHCPITCNSCP